ncbi:MAG TPA: SIMPL domain-containing protein [Acidimicrobiia bacterium]
MSKQGRFGAAAVAALSLALAAGPAAAAPTGGTDTSESRTVTGTGTGRVRGTPDTMTVDLGVDTRAETAQEALASNRELAAKVLEALRDAGVEEKDVQTSQLSVSPVYDDAGARIVGYGVTNSVTATLHDLDKAGAVIDAAAGVAGDSIRVHGVWFSIEDTSELVAAARADTVKRARDQAEQLAGAAGVALGDVRTIEETTTPIGPAVDYEEGGAADDRGAAPTPIEPGTQELAVDVVVRFAIA